MATTRLQRLAAAVRDARQARGWTQRQLAEAVGVHPQTIGNLERASHETSPEVVEKVMRALNIDLTPGAVAAHDSVAVIQAQVAERLKTMSEAERMIFVGEVMRYVTRWTPDDDETAGNGGA